MDLNSEGFSFPLLPLSCSFSLLVSVPISLFIEDDIGATIVEVEAAYRPLKWNNGALRVVCIFDPDTDLDNDAAKRLYCLLPIFSILCLLLFRWWLRKAEVADDVNLLFPILGPLVEWVSDDVSLYVSAYTLTEDRYIDTTKEKKSKDEGENLMREYERRGREYH